MSEAQKVTASEFIKKIGTLSEQAQREPVTITNHGRDSLVLMSATEFKRLKALDTRVALHPAELPDDLKEELLKSQPSKEAEAFNDEMDD